MRRNDHLRRPGRVAAEFALALLFALLLALSSGSTMANGQDATPLIQQATTAMTAVTSFSFELTTPNGQSMIFNNLELKTVTGSVLRPDRFKAAVTVKAAIVELTIKAVGVGTRLWTTNPLSPGDVYVEAAAGDGNGGSAQTLTDLLNPDRIFLRAVSLIQNPVVDGIETLDGVETTRVTGTVNLNQLSQLVAMGTPAAASSLIVLGEKPLTVWLDANHRVVQLEIAGPLTTSDSADVVRRLDLTDFDQPVDIQQPAA